MSSSTDELLKTRIQKLGGAKPNYEPKSVVYVMSRDQRVSDNHALIAAQKHALATGLPLIVLFVLYDQRIGNRAKEHLSFMLDGLAHVANDLAALRIQFVLRIGSFDQTASQFAASVFADALYVDFSPLRGAVDSRQKLARHALCPVYIVDTNNVVPLWLVSQRVEIAARTIRPKVHRLLGTYLHEPHALINHPVLLSSELESCCQSASREEIEHIVELYPPNGTDISRFTSGESAARDALRHFLEAKLVRFGTQRGDPTKDAQSELSPYLHFGQISGLRIALEVQLAVRAAGQELSALVSDRLPRASDVKPPVLIGADSVVEELIVRKTLADNFCYYNGSYKTLSAAPEWAQRTLQKHASDPREFVYTPEEFEHAKTHDPAWNAAQRQLVKTGKIHNYMRMYWAKKVLEWSKSPEEALQILLYLNDFYHIDGGDPNGYVGILWSVAGLHDRPWGERPVYGVVRSMVYDGLKRKFDVKSYETQY